MTVIAAPYQNPHLPGDRDTYIAENLRLVHSVCNKMRARAANHPALDYDDLYGYGCIGLIKAYERFDPTKFENVNSFSTYAIPLIKGEIQRVLRDVDEGPKFARSVKETYYAIAREDLLHAEPEEISEMLELDLDLVKRALEYNRVRSNQSLNYVVFEDDGESITLEDQLGEEIDYESNLILDDFLQTLKPKEREVVRLLKQDKRQSEIGEEIGVSQVQVSRIISKVMDLAEDFGKGLYKAPKKPSPPTVNIKPRENGRDNVIEMKKPKSTLSEREQRREHMIHLLKTTDFTYKRISEETGFSYQTVLNYAKEHRPKKKEEAPKVNIQSRKEEPKPKPALAESVRKIAKDEVKQSMKEVAAFADTLSYYGNKPSFTDPKPEPKSVAPKPKREKEPEKEPTPVLNVTGELIGSKESKQGLQIMVSEEFKPSESHQNIDMDIKRDRVSIDEMRGIVHKTIEALSVMGVSDVEFELKIKSK